MSNVIIPSQNFDFNQVSLLSPSCLSGDSYFTRIFYNDKPVIIQTPKSLTKQGISKSGKKFYTDLVFDNESEIFIDWIEKLEERCIDIIFNKSQEWFQNALEKDDIESAFMPCLKSFNSGKKCSLRANIQSITGDNSITIYNETKDTLLAENVNNKTKVITIIEFQGVKFNSRNFQLILDLKQIMVIDEYQLFNKFMFKINNDQHDISSNTSADTLDKISLDMNNLDNPSSCSSDGLSTHPLSESSNDITTDREDSNSIELNKIEVDKTLGNNELTTEINIHDDDSHINKSVDEINSTDEIIINDSKRVFDNEDVSETKEPANELVELGEMEFKEVDIDEMFNTSEKDLECISLKQPDDVYLDIYKEARKAAKLAKKNAIAAYLEAKKIKNTYMLDIIDSDSDIEENYDFEK